MIPSFQTTFAVPLTCEACIQSVSTSLYKLDGTIVPHTLKDLFRGDANGSHQGISNVTCNLKSQMISVDGTAPPSAIVRAIQDTGRDAILRGSGTTDGAAVCILETFSTSPANSVRGLVRMVQVAPSVTIFDLSTRGLSPGQYQATIRERGDMSEGPASTGPIWGADVARREGGRTRGLLGTVMVGKEGIGSIFQTKPIEIWEMIGRSIVVSRQQDGKFNQHDPDTVVGVIARSAGVWDNDKTVCSCTGKTVWEERTEQVDRGML